MKHSLILASGDAGGLILFIFALFISYCVSMIIVEKISANFETNGCVNNFLIFLFTAAITFLMVYIAYKF